MAISQPLTERCPPSSSRINPVSFGDSLTIKAIAKVDCGPSINGRALVLAITLFAFIITTFVCLLIVNLNVSLKIDFWFTLDLVGICLTLLGVEIVLLVVICLMSTKKVFPFSRHRLTHNEGFTITINLEREKQPLTVSKDSP
jgi:hypothetical protein